MNDARKNWGYLFALLCLSLPGLAQNPSPQPQNATPSSTQPVASFHAYTRIVTLEVVVKDRNNQHVSGMKPDDFKIFEQTPSINKERSTQKIASFREVHVADLANQSAELKVPAGTYTNIVALPKDPVPPTIILVDGLNTDIKDQAQIHVQMLRMLRQLPPNVPVAVYLFGTGVTMLQDFTTDPHLLQIALNKVLSPAGSKLAQVRPEDDSGTPGAVEQQLASTGINGGMAGNVADTELQDMISAANFFDKQVYVSDMDMRVLRTLDALTYLTYRISGYPGRKNLLWFSSAFPFSVYAFAPALGESPIARNYMSRLVKLSNLLSDAKIAVYPVDPAGVSSSVPADYLAESRPRDTTGPGLEGTLGREDEVAFQSKEVMHTLADGTGGQVCAGDNDLGDCVHKAMDDSNEYYEIAYYSNSTEWNGQYRKVTLETRQPHTHLAYRQGYYATPEGGSSPADQKAELDAACNNTLDATGVFLIVRNLPPDSSDSLKYSLLINPAALSVLPASDGSYGMNVSVVACTFNQKGWPQKMLSYPVSRKLSNEQYHTLLSGGLTETIAVPDPKVGSVRLVVQDVPSGRIGSIYIDLAKQSAETPKKN